jgi:hypothetical protein
MTVDRPVIAHGMSPYGSIGDEAGPNALGLLDNLLEPKVPVSRSIAGMKPRWDDSDLSGFNYLVRLDEDMACVDPSFDVEGSATGELIRPWQQLMISLPFTETERHWMIGAARTSQRDEREFPAGIIPVETSVISAGVRQTLRGRSLVRRWVSWRRETHEFAGQGSLTRAIFLLDHIAYELVPGMFTSPDFVVQYPHVAEFDERAKGDTHSAPAHEG